MNYCALVFAVLLTVVHTGEIKYSVCPKTKASAEIVSVSVDPCKSEPCQLVRGTSAGITLKFMPTVRSETLKTVVKGHIGFAWIPFPGVKSEACVNCGVKCPLVPNVQLSYNYTLDVSSTYPAIKTVVSWELQGDDSDVDVVCIEFPVELV